MVHVKSFIRPLALVAVCAVPVPSQCGSLATLYTGTTFCTNGGGPMFDVVALNPAGVHVSGFDVNLSAGTHSISVFVITGGGSFLGNELNAAAWTLIGTATLTSAGPGGPTPVPLAFDVFIPPGWIQGFHVRAAAGGLRYSSGGALGGVLASNADLQILIGSSQCSLVVGGGPPFMGSVPSPRQFNGTVHYNREWQTNSPSSSLDIDGVQGTSCTPAIVVKAQGAPGVLNLSSTNVGFGFEVVLALARLIPVSAGALQTANGQILNVDLGASSTLFFNGGPSPNFNVPFPGSLPIGFVTPPASLVASVQMANIDPAHADGFSLSQGAELDVL